MKKVTYTLQFGLVGAKNSGKEILLEYMKDISFETNYNSAVKSDLEAIEFLLVFNNVPIKIKVFLAENVNHIVLRSEKIKYLDVIIFSLNIFDLNAINQYNKKTFDEFSEYFTFKGVSILAGIKKEPFSSFQIDNDVLVNKAKELDVLYCFEIQAKNEDVSEMINKILSDFTFKFQYSSPEVFERAKVYGAELVKQRKP